MRELRPRPDLDQLRRQARELLRAAHAGDPDAASRLDLVSMPATLAGAQLALAREHGFPSWAKLKAEVERRSGAPPQFTIRYVRSPDELRRLWERMGDILGEPLGDERAFHWHVFDDFGTKRTTTIVVEHDGRIVGGAIQLRLVALERPARGIGLGRRVVQTVEAELVAGGATRLGAHADPGNKGFWLRIGYHESGQSKRHMYKGVPLAPTLRDRRIRRWRQRAGDLEAGVAVEVDPATGKIPPLPW